MSYHQPYVYDAFIACSHQDRSWVDGILLPRLQATGLKILVTSPLQNLDAESRHALVERINEARYVIAVLSPDSLSNQQAQFEWQVALDRNFSTGTFCLLPIKIASLEDSHIPKQLAALASVDFTKPDKLDMAFAYLLSVWK
jgi:hypothetical protein